MTFYVHHPPAKAKDRRPPSTPCGSPSPTSWRPSRPSGTPPA